MELNLVHELYRFGFGGISADIGPKNGF
jgi:hypothetical protein